MNISEQWLREWVNPALSTEELAHQITMAELEVDAIDPVAGEFAGVVSFNMARARQAIPFHFLSLCGYSSWLNPPYEDGLKECRRAF